MDVLVIFCNTGELFFWFTVTVIVAIFELVAPSFALYVIISVPMKLKFGVYVNLLLDIVAVPFDGFDVVANFIVFAGMSESVANNVVVVDIFLSVTRVIFGTVGAEFTSLTVIVND